MVSVLPTASLILGGNALPAGPGAAGTSEEDFLRLCQPRTRANVYQARQAVNRCYSVSKNIHSRSQSMPEDAYIRYHQLPPASRPHVQPGPGVEHFVAARPMVRMDKRLTVAPSASGLRRSQTNAGDFARSTGLARSLAHFSQASDAASFSNLHALSARSRSNIAALNWSTCDHHFSRSANMSSGSSCYLPPRGSIDPYLCSARSTGYLSSLAYKDLSKPLHVDCSVEYDLGNQPKIPKNSAPLLIIHPAYQHRIHTLKMPRYAAAAVPPYYHFDLTQSAPAKAHNTKLTRHSSFAVAKQPPALYTQFYYQEPTPIMTGHDPVYADELEMQHGSNKRPKSTHGHQGFHVSMPDINMEEVRRFSRGNLSKARANLYSKLDAARKLSTESRDSGTSLDSQPGSSVLHILPSFDDDDLSEDRSHVKATFLQSYQAFSDSGLGTPNSLILDEDPHLSMPTSSSTNSSTSGKKWRPLGSGKTSLPSYGCKEEKKERKREKLRNMMFNCIKLTSH